MSNLYIGTSKLKNLYVGTSKAKKIYMGTTMIWQSAIPVKKPTQLTVSKVFNNASQANGFTPQSGIIVTGSASGKNAGTYTATYTPDADHMWEDTEDRTPITVTLTITPYAISNAIIGSIPAYTYDGTQKKPEPVVTAFGANLVKGTDYTLSYSNNINAGTATVTVTGIGNYSGTKTKTYSIAKANGSISLSKTTLSIRNKNSDTFTVTATGAISAVSSNTNVARVSVSGNTVTVNAVSAGGGSATITVTSAATANYNAATAKATMSIPTMTFYAAVTEDGYADNDRHKFIVSLGTTWQDAANGRVTNVDNYYRIVENPERPGTATLQYVSSGGIRIRSLYNCVSSGGSNWFVNPYPDEGEERSVVQNLSDAIVSGKRYRTYY